LRTGVLLPLFEGPTQDQNVSPGDHISQRVIQGKGSRSRVEYDQLTTYGNDRVVGTDLSGTKAKTVDDNPLGERLEVLGARERPGMEARATLLDIGDQCAQESRGLDQESLGYPPGHALSWERESLKTGRRRDQSLGHRVEGIAAIVGFVQRNLLDAETITIERTIGLPGLAQQSVVTLQSHSILPTSNMSWSPQSTRDIGGCIRWKVARIEPHAVTSIEKG